MERPEILSQPLGIRETDDADAPPNINDMGLQFDVATLLSQRSLSRRQRSGTSGWPAWAAG
jgi:hypothetical protein